MPGQLAYKASPALRCKKHLSPGDGTLEGFKGTNVNFIRFKGTNIKFVIH